VLEALRAGRWPVLSLFVSDELAPQELSEAIGLADTAGVTLQQESRQRLTELSGSEHHQGFVARMGEYPYSSVHDLLDQVSTLAPTDGRWPLLVVFDRIQDTFNFGAILRCCDAMNVAGVVIGSVQQAGATPQVARSSSGAVHHVPIAVTDDLLAATREIQQAGFCVAAASEKSTAAAWTSQLTSPIALIIGSEAHGVSDELIDLCTQHLRIPMLGQVTSLNAAVAAGILLYEIRRQQLS